MSYCIFSIVIPSTVSLCIALIIAKFQNRRSDRQMKLAEEERTQNLYTLFISIVEEHIINDITIDTIRLERMIGIHKEKYRVNKDIDVLDVIGRAEVNMLSSRYLDIKRKGKCGRLFDDIYDDYNTRKLEQSGQKPSASLGSRRNELIRERKESESLEYTRKTIDAYAIMKKEWQKSKQDNR